jgi:hypothetical protein
LTQIAVCLSLWLSTVNVVSRALLQVDLDDPAAVHVPRRPDETESPAQQRRVTVGSELLVVERLM